MTQTRLRRGCSWKYSILCDLSEDSRLLISRCLDSPNCPTR